MKKSFVFALILVMLLSLTACGEKAPAAPDMTALYEEMAKTLPEMVLLDEMTMLDFLGIDTQDCAQAVVATCADGLITDEVWLIEAQDAEALARISALAQTRLTAKAEESISYSPEQYAVVQKAQLLTEGNCLALLVSPEVTVLQTVFENAVK